MKQDFKTSLHRGLSYFSNQLISNSRIANDTGDLQPGKVRLKRSTIEMITTEKTIRYNNYELASIYNPQTFKPEESAGGTVS